MKKSDAVPEQPTASEPKPKPLTGAALDRALKAGNQKQWNEKGRKSFVAPSNIRMQPKRGKS